MNLTSAQYISDAPVLAKVTDGNYTLHVTNATLDQLDALNADAKVTQIQVREGTSAVSSHLAALANTTTLNQISLSDTAATMRLTPAHLQKSVAISKLFCATR